MRATRPNRRSASHREPALYLVWAWPSLSRVGRQGEQASTHAQLNVTMFLKPVFEQELVPFLEPICSLPGESKCYDFQYFGPVGTKTGYRNRSQKWIRFVTQNGPKLYPKATQNDHRKQQQKRNCERRDRSASRREPALYLCGLGNMFQESDGRASRRAPTLN